MTTYNMQTCILCQQDFRFGPNAYDGRYVRAWDDMICRSCDDGNHDGIVADDSFLARLDAKGVTPEINDSGWVVIPSRGS
ncbi:hypothetical protein [Terricaulis sp.]|uniref:hypothetical protein n=1 Tax=Terricaulis sp. TaxID=2768686 RepID=UPI002AC3AF97|nr:hypothetical protein [Terricaulis sp.]MDZ4693424.1 hypothetical protein [Terricaulis sp.]